MSEHSREEYNEEVRGLYTATQEFMDRCRQENCSAAVGELAVASGFMVSRSSLRHRKNEYYEIHPRLVILAARTEEERYVYDIATFRSATFEAPFMDMVRVLPLEAHHIPQYRKPSRRLTIPSLRKLTYSVGTSRPTKTTEQEAAHFYDRMVEYLTVGQNQSY